MGVCDATKGSSLSNEDKCDGIIKCVVNVHSGMLICLCVHKTCVVYSFRFIEGASFRMHSTDVHAYVSVGGAFGSKIGSHMFKTIQIQFHSLECPIHGTSVCDCNCFFVWFGLVRIHWKLKIIDFILKFYFYSPNYYHVDRLTNNEYAQKNGIKCCMRDQDQKLPYGRKVFFGIHVTH